MIIGSAAAGGLAALVIGHLPWVAEKIGGTLAGKGAEVVKEQAKNWIKNRETQQQLRDAVENALRKTKDSGYRDFDQLFYQGSLAEAIATAAIVPRQLIEPDYKEILRQAVRYSANREYALKALESFFPIFRQEWENQPAFGSVSSTYASTLTYFEVKRLRESLLESKTEPDLGLLVADQVEELLDEYAKLFVGREDTLKELDEFVTQKPRGFFVLTAPPGFGKTALLANWAVSLRNGRPLAVKNNTPVFVAYHFFNNRFPDTCSPTNALRNLLHQLLPHYRPDNKLPSNELEVKDYLVGIVRHHAGRMGEVLIIVLDGLDEADEPFSTLPFPPVLPENVFVIASARADEGEAERPYLSAWTDKATKPPLKLEPLSPTAIAEWLQQVDNGTLSALATDTNFVAQLAEVTQGFPLYLRYLIDDLQESVKQGKDARAVLAKTPREFKKYVYQQLRSLDKLKLSKKTRKFFALLAVAKGPLRREEFKAKALIGMNDEELRMLSDQWQVTRWLRITQEEDTILYASFAHPLLGETFAEKLGDKAEKALERLLAYCEGWSEHKSPYALQHYAEHLQENKQTEALFRLVRDGVFLRAQMEKFPDDLDLPLRTVQIALRCAAEKDDAGAMAEFLLAHARQLLVSPLELARAGNPSRSLTGASKMEYRVLWYLLLAWEFKEKRDGENALKALKNLRLLDMRLPPDWQSRYAAYLLSHVFEVDEDMCMLLSRQFLDEDDLPLLCRYLVAQRRFSFARKVALGMQDKGNQAKKVLLELAEAQVETGALDDAREAMEEQVGWSSDYYREDGLREDGLWEKIARAYAVVAVEQAQAKKLQEAEQTIKTALQAANHVGNKRLRVKILVAIAKAQAQADQRDNARTTFITARGIVQEIELKPEEGDILERLFSPGVTKAEQAKALADIAIAQAQVGEIGDALETAWKIADVKERAKVLREIVVIHAQAQAFDDALRVLEQIDDTKERILALVFIAIALTSTKNEEAKKLVTEALQTAREIQPGKGQVKIFRKIAVAQVQMGDKQEARNTLAAAGEQVQKIADRRQQVKLLNKIARAQFQLGEEEEAKTTFSTALKAIQDEEPGEVLEDLIIAQAQVGFAADALEAAGQIKAHGKRIEMMKEVALAQAHLGKNVECRRILTLACETVQNIRWDFDIDGEQERKNLAIAQAQQEFFSDAFETAHKIRNGLELAETCLAIGRVLMDKNEQDRGSEAFVEARKAAEAFTPPPPPFEQIFQLWPKRFELLLQIAEAQAQAGEEEETRTTIALTLIGEERSGEESQLSAVTLAEIAVAPADAWRQKGDTVNAQKALVAASQSALEIKGFEQKKRVLSMITREQIQMKDWDGVLRTAKAVEEQAGVAEIIVRDMSELAVLQAQEGKEEAAQETLKAAQDVMQENTDSWEPEGVRALVSLAIAQARIGKKEEAEASFTAARESAHEVGKEHVEREEAMTLLVIATGQAEVGAFEDAYMTAQMIRYDQVRGEALKAIAVRRMAKAIRQFTEGNQEQVQKTFDSAIQLSQEIPRDEERVAAFEEIGIILAQANRRDNAQEAFVKAFEIAESMMRQPKGGQVMMELAVAQAQAQEFEEAVKTIQEIVLFWDRQQELQQVFGDLTQELLQVFRDRQQELWLSAAGFSAIAGEQAKASKKSEALKTFAEALRNAQKIENTPDRMKALGLIAQRQARVGFGMQALQTADLILTNRNDYLQMIAWELLNAGDIDHVKQLLIPCAYYLDAAYKMCVLLAWAYPEQAEAVAKAVRNAA